MSAPTLEEQLLATRDSMAAGDMAGAFGRAGALIRNPQVDDRAFMDLGMMFLDAKIPGFAVDCFTRAQRHPLSRAVATYYRSVALNETGRPGEARKCLREAVRGAADEPALAELGRLDLFFNDVAAAKSTLWKLRTAFPGCIAGPMLLARAAVNEGDLDEARRQWGVALGIASGSTKITGELLTEQGYIFQTRGEFEAAEAAFLAAIEADPEVGKPFSLLAHSRKIVEGDAALIEKARSRLASSADPYHAYHLEFALAKAHHDLKDYPRAAHHYAEANRLGRLTRGRQLEPAGPAMAKLHERILPILKPATIERLKMAGEPTDAPVFVVGMIRTGTTLMEQIVASHPSVTAAGELDFWPKNSGAFFDFQKGEVVTPALRMAAREYVQLLQAVGPGAARVTDKNPTNVSFLGLLHAAMPRAKFISMRRNAIDVAMSVWMTPIESDAPFLGDKRDIVDVIREVEKVADHWESTLPSDQIVQVRYEDLVADKEAVTRKVFGFLGLGWDDQVLKHETSRREVLTPSMWQVRQKVYTTSVDRWRPYEPWLGELASLIPGR